MSEEQRIAIVDLADDLQVRKQRIFKILPRLGIRPTQRRETSRGNQNVATVSQAEAAAIRSQIERSSEAASAGDARSGTLAAFSSDDVGFFYLIQLEPDHDSGRFKVGFTVDLDGRLQKHRCSAPFARYVASWPCRRVWERAAIDCVTTGCEQLHTEVFRSASMEQVSVRAQEFFTMMPGLEAEVADDEEAESENTATPPLMLSVGRTGASGDDRRADHVSRHEGASGLAGASARCAARGNSSAERRRGAASPLRRAVNEHSEELTASFSVVTRTALRIRRGEHRPPPDDSE